MSPRCFVSWMIRVITSGHILLRFLKWSGWCSDYLLPASRFKTKGKTRKLCAWNNIWVWRPCVRSKKKKKKHPKRVFIRAVSGAGCWGQCGDARHRGLPRPRERAGTRLLGGLLERHQGRRGGRSDNDRGHAAVGDIVAPFAVVFPVITC